jgi:hypothetical protein
MNLADSAAMATVTGPGEFPWDTNQWYSREAFHGDYIGGYP